MGICNSCEATSVATAKLIRQDGRLEEFPFPIRVSQVLQQNPNCFICNADDMDLNDMLLAINVEEELRVGELYFALPLTWLNSPLRVEKMSALVVKASSALKMDVSKMGDKWYACRCGKKQMDSLVFSSNRVSENSSCIASVRRDVIVGNHETLPAAKRRRSTAGRGRRRKSCDAKLSVILEE